jgi:hypothetical protein
VSISIHDRELFPCLHVLASKGVALARPLVLHPLSPVKGMDFQPSLWCLYDISS